MNNNIHEQRRLSYSHVVASYDKYRPGYPQEVCKTLVTRYGLNAAGRVLEIGCGTGQFTAHLAQIGCPVDALDASADMVAFAQGKHPGPSVTFHASTFEDFPAAEESYDFITAATAFHWVGPQARLHKTASLLKPGGILAFFYNQYAEDSVRHKITKAYQSVLGLQPGQVPVTDNKTEVIFEELQNSSQFTNAQEFSFPNTVNYSTESYLGMQGTHSYQNTLTEAQRTALFSAMREVIEHHGGHVEVSYQTKLFCLQKAAS